MLVGGASSGKTTAAREVARILNRPFEITGAVASAFELKGYEDGAGHYHASACRRAVEGGAVFLCDEWNRSVPPAQMFMQAGLANNMWPFPDRTIESHPNFLCIAADNTSGRGQDRLYTTANQQDAAALDRWVYLRWEIDEWLEAKLFGDGNPIPQPPRSGESTEPPLGSLQFHYNEFLLHLTALNRVRASKALRDACGCEPHTAVDIVENFLDKPYLTNNIPITLIEFRALCATHGSVPDEHAQAPGMPALAPALSCGDWVRRIQRIRKAIADLGERHLVTMRASDYGGRLLTAGLDLAKVEEMCVWKGLSPETVKKIKHHAGIGE